MVRSSYRIESLELLQAEQYRFVLVEAVPSAVVLEDTLHADVGSIILYHAHDWRDGHHERQVELKVAPSALLALRKDAVEDSEQLQNALFPPRVPLSRELDGKRMYASVMTTYLESTVADADATNDVHVW